MVFNGMHSPNREFVHAYLHDGAFLGKLEQHWLEALPDAILSCLVNNNFIIRMQHSE